MRDRRIRNHLEGRVLALLVLAVLLISVMPGSTAQSQGAGEGVTFYGHTFSVGLNGPNPANTQPPVGEANLGIGTAANCKNVGPTTPPAPGIGDGEDCQEEEDNKLVLYSTAGPVDVDTRSEFLQNGAYAQLHNERGQTKPVHLDTSGTVTATVYATWDSHGWYVGNSYGTKCVYPHPENVPCLYPYWGWDPGVYENVVMEATLYHADLGSRENASAPPPIHEAIDDAKAQVVAQGQWGPDRVMTGLPGTPNVQRFDVDLGAPQKDTIPRSDDFFLVFNTYQSLNGVNHCMNCPVRWWSGELFPPSFELPVENAFTVERTVPEFANGKLATLGILNTPWGSYDVDSGSVDVDIEGPQGSVETSSLTQYSDFSVAHGGHFDPVNVTWVWDYRADDARPGEYEVTVSGANTQGSAAADCTATLTIEESSMGQPVPGETSPAQCGIQGIGTEETVAEATRSVEGSEPSS